MTTIADVIERLRRTWLEPPDYQPPATLLDGVITDVDLTLILQGFMIPEDEQYLKTGSILELNSELVRVVGYVPSTRTATLTRAEYGTTAAAHDDGTFVRLAPAFPRLSIFEAIRDAINLVGRDLFTVRTVNLVAVAGNVSPLNDSLALSPLKIWPDGWVSDEDMEGEIVDYHPAAGGRALMTHGFHGNLWLKYKRRTGVATVETEVLSDLGVEDTWIPIIMAAAAADLFAGRDLPASFTEWVGATLQAETIPVGTRYQIAAALRSYHERLLANAAKEMEIEYRPRIQFLDPLRGF